LGELLAPILGHDVPQTTISRWEIGSVSIDLEQLRAVEAALGLTPGTLFANSGYCRSQFTPRDVENAIRSDRALDPSLKDTVVSMYRSAVTLSKKIKVAERPRRQQSA
jgi:transcriptional regulator with XRE-family HTH domain